MPTQQILFTLTSKGQRLKAVPFTLIMLDRRALLKRGTVLVIGEEEEGLSTTVLVAVEVVETGEENQPVNVHVWVSSCSYRILQILTILTFLVFKHPQLLVPTIEPSHLKEKK